MRPISKVNKKKFAKEAIAYLESVGAKPLPAHICHLSDHYHEMVLQTVAGRMTVSVDTDPKEIYTVFCRFDDPKRAAEYVDCNPYSGKYNFHATNYVFNNVLRDYRRVRNVQDVLDGFKRQIDRVKPVTRQGFKFEVTSKSYRLVLNEETYRKINDNVPTEPGQGWQGTDWECRDDDLFNHSVKVHEEFKKAGCNNVDWNVGQNFFFSCEVKNAHKAKEAVIAFLSCPFDGDPVKAIKQSQK